MTAAGCGAGGRSAWAPYRGGCARGATRHHGVMDQHRPTEHADGAEDGLPAAACELAELLAHARLYPDDFPEVPVAGITDEEVEDFLAADEEFMARLAANREDPSRLKPRNSDLMDGDR